MKIVMFSINPIYPDVVTGGASKHLYHIARHLGSIGHDIEILCPQTDKTEPQFIWAENVRVLPVLPFHVPFPQPYAISGPDMALILAKILVVLKNADRFYIHDGELLIPDVYENLPTIASFRDNVYPESVLGSFVSKADDIICVSEFSAEVIEHTAGRFFPGLKKRLHVVNNGIDFDVFSQRDSSSLAEELGVNPENEVLLLHPHRPEPGKGLPETIKVVNKLVHQHGIANLRVLIPEWIDSMVSAKDSEFYQTMVVVMEDLGVRDHFLFMPWMPIERMPALYSLGVLTLCLGNIVEAFGNVAYESLACGTPSIVARVGVHRTLMPDNLVNKVHFGDIDAVVEKVLAILTGEKTLNNDVISYLHTTMDFDRQVSAYAKIITTCQKRDRLTFSMPDDRLQQGYRLASWCYFNGDHIYHDFHGVFESAMELAELLKESTLITREGVALVGVAQETWDSWIERTWIIPVSSSKERKI